MAGSALKPFKGKFKPMEVLTGPYDPGGQPETRSGNAMELGFFAWNINCGTTCSRAVLLDPERHQTYWHWDIASRLVPEAERVGFEYQVPFARWVGHDGETDYNEASLDFLSSAAAMTPLTNKLLLFSTAHCAYAFHPMHYAKFGASMDYMSNGRWGLNIVAGYSHKEFAAFGLEPPGHDEAYARADEFVTLMKHLWHEDEPIEFEGAFYQTYGGLILPKPVRKPRPILMSAGQSDVGIDFAARHADWVFCIQPDIESYRNFVNKVHDRAAKYDRKVRVATHAYALMDVTDERARSTADRVAEEIDRKANLIMNESFMTQSTSETFGWESSDPDDPWGGMDREAFVRLAMGIGAHHLIGSYETVAEELRALSEVGVESALVSSFDPLRMLHQMEDDVLPIMRKMGVRK
jgi:FMNH2-dependent dimethyl sulfone monooxygenase